MIPNRILVHISRTEHRVFDPADVYHLEANGGDWELKLEPPVNRVLPIARDRLKELRRSLGESED